MTLVWLEMALSHLDEVFNYYAQYSEQRAYRIVNEIYDTGQILQNHPEAGKVEGFYQETSQTYRSLITYKGLYKILYYQEQDTIYIFAVWCCRQDPAGLENLVDSIIQV
ncbi:MAG: type II toxin-antitoxin system RelE/ParE family toxin [Tannerellaceae bacterium]|nr:type II toxin-antitoxin system RelE/ParE family toxin [Tannerellaceae bacterium]